MAAIVIIGAGVMGSAVAVPAADNGHSVSLVGTHLDRDIVAALQRDRASHPRLGAPLPAAVWPVDLDALTPSLLASAALILVAVSSPGIYWAADLLRDRLPVARPVALVTKGLDDTGGSRPRLMTDVIAEGLIAGGLAGCPIIGIGGPCIARELALRRLTAVVYAGASAPAVQAACALMETPYYRTHPDGDITGLEAAAALKNFMAIAVSAVATRQGLGDAPWSLNAASFAFTQAQLEMRSVVAWLGGLAETCDRLAGMGDLHVTVGGGRNSRLGRHLGQGLTVAEACAGPLAGETVEGVDTGRALARGLAAAIEDGRLDPGALPMTRALIAAILDDTPFAYRPDRLV